MHCISVWFTHALDRHILTPAEQTLQLLLLACLPNLSLECKNYLHSQTVSWGCWRFVKPLWWLRDQGCNRCGSCSLPDTDTHRRLAASQQVREVQTACCEHCKYAFQLNLSLVKRSCSCYSPSDGGARLIFRIGSLWLLNSLFSEWVVRCWNSASILELHVCTCIKNTVNIILLYHSIAFVEQYGTRCVCLHLCVPVCLLLLDSLLFYKILTLALPVSLEMIQRTQLQEVKVKPLSCLSPLSKHC